MRNSLKLALGAGMLALAPHVALADAVKDFYSGKTMQIRVGYGPGGAYDLGARLVSRYIAQYIPGNPQIVVQNMPGGASLVLTQYLLSAAPKDGSVIGLISRGIAFEPLLKAPRSDFDPLALNWLGTFERASSFCAVWHTAGITSLKDITNGGKTLIVGGTGPASDDELYARVVREMLGANVKIVTGYKGSSAVHIAMEAGEVNARCNLSAADLLRRPEWLNEKKVNLILQNGMQPHPQFPDVPMTIKAADDPDRRAVLELFFTRLDMAYPFVAPPGTPEDRVKALREALMKTVADPGFVAEAKKLFIEINAVSGEEMTDMIKRIYALPQKTIEMASELRNQ